MKYHKKHRRRRRGVANPCGGPTLLKVGLNFANQRAIAEWQSRQAHAGVQADGTQAEREGKRPGRPKRKGGDS